MKHCWHYKTHVIDLKAGVEHIAHCCHCNRICAPTLAPSHEHGRFSGIYEYKIPAEVDAEECPARKSSDG